MHMCQSPLVDVPIRSVALDLFENHDVDKIRNYNLLVANYYLIQMACL